MQPGDVVEHLHGAHAAPGAAALEHHADAGEQVAAVADRVEAEHPDRALLRSPVALAGLQRGGLAGAVGPEHGGDRAPARRSARGRRRRPCRRTSSPGRRRETAGEARGHGRQCRDGPRVARLTPSARRPRQVRVAFLEAVETIKAHWCCGIRRGPVPGARPADASARRPVDPRQRTLDRGGARRAARPDPGRRPPPPRPAARGGRGRGPRAAQPGAPRPRPAGQGLRADRVGRDGFDQQYDDLAAQALRFLAETGGDDAVREFATRRVAFIRERFEGDPRGAPRAGIRGDPGAGVHRRGVRRRRSASSPVGEQLCQQHCPVAHVAHEFPQLCEAETEAISLVLGSHVQRLATIAHGDGVCTTCIPSTSSTTPTKTKERVS